MIDVSNLSFLSHTTPSSDRFLELGTWVHELSDLTPIQAKNNRISSFYIEHSHAFNPTSLDNSPHTTSTYFLRVSFWYHCIKVLTPVEIEHLMDAYRTIRADAHQLVQTQESCTLCVIHTGANVSDHIHPVVQTLNPQVTLAYCIRIPHDLDVVTSDPLEMRIGDAQFRVFDANNVTRVCFDASTHLHGTRCADPKTTYLWFVFDGITKMVNRPLILTDEIYDIRRFSND